MPVYSEPAANRFCQCASPREAADCTTGHGIECHYPFDCPTAGCGHLWLYDYSPAEIADLKKKALETIRADGRYTVYGGGEYARVKEQTPEETEGPFTYG